MVAVFLVNDIPGNVLRVVDPRQISTLKGIDEDMTFYAS